MAMAGISSKYILDVHPDLEWLLDNGKRLLESAPQSLADKFRLLFEGPEERRFDHDFNTVSAAGAFECRSTLKPTDELMELITALRAHDGIGSAVDPFA